MSASPAASNRVRVAIVGAGRIGAVHARTVNDHPGADLALIADPAGSAAADLSAVFGVPWSVDAEEALSREGVDAVIVASPTPLHIPHTLAAVGAGKAVLMEKPVALDLASVDACLDSLGSRADQVMVGFNRRFDPSIAELAARVKAGEIGAVEQVTIISRDPAPPPAAYLAVSGGIFKDMTIHDLDMARHLLGDVTTVRATGQHLDESVEDTYDAATLTLTSRSGAVAVIINSRHSAAGYDQRLEVFGSRGALEVTNQRSTSVRLHDASGTERAGAFLPFFLERYQRAYVAEFEAFVTAIGSGSAPSPSLHDGRAALVLAEAAAESARTGATVAVSETRSSS